MTPSRTLAVAQPAAARLSPDEACANNQLPDLLQLQLDELRHEVAATEGASVLEFNLPPLQPLKPARLMDTLRHQTAQLTLDTHHLRQQLPLLEDLPTLERWLKEQRAAMRARQEEEALLSLFGR